MAKAAISAEVDQALDVHGDLFAELALDLYTTLNDLTNARHLDLVEENRLRLRRAQAAAIDPGAEPLQRIRQGAEASVRYMATYSHFFALLEVENLEKQFADELRRGTEVHADDVGALIRAGIDDGTVRDEDPRLLAYGVVGTVGYYGHFHRTGRMPIGQDELAAFVGRFVVCSLASNEKIARRVLAAPALPAVVGAS